MESALFGSQCISFGRTSYLEAQFRKSAVQYYTAAAAAVTHLKRLHLHTTLPNRKVIYPWAITVNAALAGLPDPQTADILSSSADVAIQKEKIVLPQGETWSVHKFGGTCVGSCERIQNVADIIVKDSSQRKVVVVSAMSKVTDMLYSLVDAAQRRKDSYIEALQQVYEKHKSTATALLGDDGDDLKKFLCKLKDDIDNLQAMLKAIYIAGHATESFSDFVVGHGELWSAQMLTAALRKRGVACVWMDAREVVTVNLTSASEVDPDFEASEIKLFDWYARNPSDTIVVTGFIASTIDNIPTTLKRDGSDFSAAIMGALFRAGNVNIWTDVDGVFSADPRKVSEAVVLSSLSYQEAWEMSYFGAKVLHPRTTLPVMKYNIPVTIRNVFNLSAPGTKIQRSSLENGEFRAADSVVKGFATVDNLALVNVEGTGMAGVPGTASDIFQTVKQVGANVVMISQASSEHSVCFAVPEKEVKAVAEALENKFRRALGSGRISKIEVIHDCSVLAAVGQKMASTPGVSATLFSALAKANINVRAIAQGCSEYNVTVVVDKADSTKALKAVHSRFYLSRTPLAVGIIGPGLIGGTLLQQLNEQQQQLKQDFNIELRVLGIIGSKSMLLSQSGLNLFKWKQMLKEEGEDANLNKFTSHMTSNHSFPNIVIVDCTASSDVAENYYSWIRNGVHVVTPNKKANSGPLDKYLKLKKLQRKSYTHYFYEATVGAGLPIVSTLQGLLETGDHIHKVEGIFSGTLSYIFNNFDGRETFSQVVKKAKEAGYTEPDPRDDLSGMDVARKVIILARECGLQLSLEDLNVESLVPEALRGCETVDEFMDKLPAYDDEMEVKRQAAEADGEALRYVGIVDVVGNKGSVELRRYSKSNALTQLRGSENIISFTTKRYREEALIVRGPGAGAQVTAAGVFSDLLKLASHLGAPS